MYFGGICKAEGLFGGEEGAALLSAVLTAELAKDGCTAAKLFEISKARGLFEGKEGAALLA